MLGLVEVAEHEVMHEAATTEQSRRSDQGTDTCHFQFVARSSSQVEPRCLVLRSTLEWLDQCEELMLEMYPSFQTVESTMDRMTQQTGCDTVSVAAVVALHCILEPTAEGTLIV